jgi:hypothetical protein
LLRVVDHKPTEVGVDVQAIQPTKPSVFVGIPEFEGKRRAHSTFSDAIQEPF